MITRSGAALAAIVTCILLAPSGAHAENARFIQVILNRTDDSRFHLGELEAFEDGVVPDDAGGANFDGLSTSTNDIGNGTLVAFNVGAVVPAVGTTQQLEHGGGNQNPNNGLETGGGVWSTANGLGVTPQYTLDLGATLDVTTVRMWPRADGCCDNRWRNLEVNLIADDGTGNPGAVVATAVDAIGGLNSDRLESQDGNHSVELLFNAGLDTDGDGLSDSYETANGLDPDDNGLNPNNNGVEGDPNNGADGDPDNDGSTNIEEFDRRTDPQNDDTDDDGLLDGVENLTGEFDSLTETGTDPTNPDTDNDGLLDGVENPLLPYDPANADEQPGTDPNDLDSDDDQAPDGFEVSEGTDPTDPDDSPGLVTVQPSFNPIGGFGANAGYVRGEPGMTYQENHYNGGVIFNNNAQNNYDVHTSGNPAPNMSQDRIQPYLDHGPGGTTISSNNLPFITAGENFTVRVNGYICLLVPGDYAIHIGADDTNLFVLDTPEGTITGQHNCCPQDIAFPFTVTTPGYYPIDNVFGEQGGGDWTDLGISGPGIVGTVALGDTDAGSPPVFQIESDPTDEDGDGLPDVYELSFGAIDNLNQLGPDPGDFDEDGVLDVDEFANGTNPTEKDSDGDGLDDNVETGTGTFVSAGDTGTNPLNTDSDGDGLEDGVEDPTLPFVNAAQPGTDPNDADTDGDSFRDGIEVTLGSDPTRSDDIPPTGTAVLVGTVDEIFGPDDLNLDSQVVIAVDTFGNADLVVNGVTFQADGPAGGVGTVTNGDVTVTTSAANQIDNWAAAPAFVGADPTSVANLGEIMRDIRWEAAPNPLTVDIAGLSPGSLYEIQLLFNEGANRNRHWDIGVEDELVVDNITSEGHADPGGGVWTPNNSARYTGEFVAPADGILNIAMQQHIGGQAQMGSDNNPILQAVIVRLSDDRPFAITEIIHDPAANEFTLTWTSNPGKTYALFFDTDLGEFESDVDDGIPAAEDTETTTFGPFPNPDPGSPRLFFRVEEQ